MRPVSLSFCSNKVFYNINKLNVLHPKLCCSWLMSNIFFLELKSSRSEVLQEISQNLQENNCARFFINKIAGLRPATLLKKETLAQMFSCEFYEISKNTIWHKTPLVAASVSSSFDWSLSNTFDFLIFSRSRSSQLIPECNCYSLSISLAFKILFSRTLLSLAKSSFCFFIRQHFKNIFIFFLPFHFSILEGTMRRAWLSKQHQPRNAVLVPLI